MTTKEELAAMSPARRQSQCHDDVQRALAPLFVLYPTDVLKFSLEGVCQEIIRAEARAARERRAMSGTQPKARRVK